LSFIDTQDVFAELLTNFHSARFEIIKIAADALNCKIEIWSDCENKNKFHHIFNPIEKNSKTKNIEIIFSGNFSLGHYIAVLKIFFINK
jgi:hypothetical protein